eukprot:TRINITY_DN1093_c0_g1_i23.p2 TRINITY_DN1093_c0_g1~~TRINITY_DN1093_c0_g1_i23.p2  ORF type:complete len:117 (-),score=16.84 TRINITY_DN1093_c0_g1_i23:111-461(-)
MCIRDRPYPPQEGYAVPPTNYPPPQYASQIPTCYAQAAPVYEAQPMYGAQPVTMTQPQVIVLGPSTPLLEVEARLRAEELRRLEYEKRRAQEDQDAACCLCCSYLLCCCLAAAANS